MLKYLGGFIAIAIGYMTAWTAVNLDYISSSPWGTLVPASASSPSSSTASSSPSSYSSSSASPSASTTESALLLPQVPGLVGPDQLSGSESTKGWAGRSPIDRVWQPKFPLEGSNPSRATATNWLGVGSSAFSVGMTEWAQLVVPRDDSVSRTRWNRASSLGNSRSNDSTSLSTVNLAAMSLQLGEEPVVGLAELSAKSSQVVRFLVCRAKNAIYTFCPAI
ncbi:unnamed protein product [Protopolystoma xenopodis]|uniref:Uncharacterized protein n=1 Tax=Protopolystoma xenopodis TaxID=117903 RepID=A0A448X2F7_9PLAT|nr:unnamed protein product [Protopolystoma xenopodis]